MVDPERVYRYCKDQIEDYIQSYRILNEKKKDEGAVFERNLIFAVPDESFNSYS